MEAAVALCEQHAKRLTHVCLSKNCGESARLCFTCLRQTHRNCDDNFIFPAAELADFLHWPPMEKPVEKMLKDAESSMEIKLESLNKETQNIKKNLFDGIRKNLASLNEPNFWTFVRENFDVVFSQNEKLRVKAKFPNNEENLNEIREKFEEDLERKLNNFLLSLSQLNFRLKETKEISDWEGSKFIQVKLETERKVTLMNSFFSFSRFVHHVVVNSKALTNSKYKITILSVNSDERFINIGVINKATYRKIKANDFVFGQDDCVSFYGFGRYNMTGKLPAAGPADARGFAPGLVFFLEFAEGEKLRIYTASKSVDLTGKENCRQDNAYFLFVEFYLQGSECSVERID